MKAFKWSIPLVLGFTLAAGPGAFAKPAIEDRKLEMELKKAAPLTVVDRAHGPMRLTRNGAFALVGKGRFGVAGSWKVENQKLILRWQNSDEILELDVKNEKDGLRLGGQKKDAKGVFTLSGE